MTISKRAKESFKIALAMVITYGISLALDWDNLIAGVETCFQGVDRLLSGQPALHDRKVLELPLDERALGELSHFQRVAMVSCRERVLAIGSLAFTSGGITYFIGPTFQWSIFNYGRLTNNVRVHRRQIPGFGYMVLG